MVESLLSNQDGKILDKSKISAAEEEAFKMSSDLWKIAWRVFLTFTELISERDFSTYLFSI